MFLSLLFFRRRKWSASGTKRRPGARRCGKPVCVGFSSRTLQRYRSRQFSSSIIQCALGNTNPPQLIQQVQIPLAAPFHAFHLLILSSEVRNKRRVLSDFTPSEKNAYPHTQHKKAARLHSRFKVFQSETQISMSSVCVLSIELSINSNKTQEQTKTVRKSKLYPTYTCLINT